MSARLPMHCALASPDWRAAVQLKFAVNSAWRPGPVYSTTRRDRAREVSITPLTSMRQDYSPHPRDSVALGMQLQFADCNRNQPLNCDCLPSATE